MLVVGGAASTLVVGGAVSMPIVGGAVSSLPVGGAVSTLLELALCSAGSAIAHVCASLIVPALMREGDLPFMCMNCNVHTCMCCIWPVQLSP